MNTVEQLLTTQQPKAGDLWFDMTTDETYIIMRFEDKLYGVSLSDGRIYSYDVNNGPFVDDSKDFIKLNNPIVLIPEVDQRLAANQSIA